MSKGPCIKDVNTLIAAGIDPKTGLPYRMENIYSNNNKREIERQLKVKDRADAVNRYIWHGTPLTLTSQEIERLVYLKQNLVFFYFKDLEQYYLMPYALNGTIDFYARYNTVHPVPMAAGSTEMDRDNYRLQLNALSRVNLKIVYAKPDELNNIKLEDDRSIYGVILRDYTNGISQSGESRETLQEPVIKILADCIPFLRTALINSTGIEGMRVDNEADYSNVIAANNSIYQAALSGQKFIPVTGNANMQELTGGQVGKAEDFMMAFQAIDNYRLSLLGLANGGVFQKKSHVLQSEEDINDVSSNSVLEDGLKWRQSFCEIANAVFGLNMSVEINPSAIQQLDESNTEDLGDQINYEGDKNNE